MLDRSQHRHWLLTSRAHTSSASGCKRDGIRDRNVRTQDKQLSVRGRFASLEFQRQGVKRSSLPLPRRTPSSQHSCLRLGPTKFYALSPPWCPAFGDSATQCVSFVGSPPSRPCASGLNTASSQHNERLAIAGTSRIQVNPCLGKAAFKDHWEMRVILEPSRVKLYIRPSGSRMNPITGLVILLVSIEPPTPIVIIATEPSIPTFHPAVR